jgi:hypothetical protein
MKIKHLLGAMLISLASSAQIVTEFGNSPADQATGLSQANGSFLLTGNEQQGNSNNLVLIKSADGFPIFASHYQLRNSANTALRVRGTRVVGLPGGSSFVAGTFTNAPATNAAAGIFTSIINGSGVPQNTLIWQAPSSVTGNPEVTAAIMSPNQDALFVCGNIVTNSTGSSVIFVISLDLNMNVNWSAMYDAIGLSNERVNDMVFSPFANELQLVGSVSATILYQSIIAIRVNATTGGAVFGTRITIANGSMTGNAVVAQTDPDESGFIITGGILNANLNNDLLTVRISDNNTSTVLSASSIPYGGNASITGMKIGERTNASGTDYVILGQVSPGSIGGTDLTLLSLNNQASISSDIITYGKSGTNETAAGLSLDNNDISMLATTSAGVFNSNSSDFYFPQTGGALRSGCNFQSRVGQQNRFTPQQITTSVSATNGLQYTSGTLLFQGSINAFTTCSPSRLGSFAETEKDNSITSVAVFPNPVAAGTALQVNLNAPQSGEVHFTITDMTGREVAVQTILKSEGESQHEISLPPNIAPGIYSITIIGAGLNEKKRLSVY